MIVLITGLPLFTKKIEKDLNEFDSKNMYIALNTYYSIIDKVKFFILLPFSKIVISFNGVTDNSGTLNAVLLFKKKLIMQWMGTDALLAIERNTNKTINRKYIDYAIHFVDSSWQQKEVESLGIKTNFIRFKYGREIDAVKEYKEVAILSYIAQNKQEFYGIKKVLIAAQDFPETQFRIVGLKNSDYELPSNVTLLGWVEEQEMIKELQNAAILLRMTDHDGFSVSVIEALSVGAEVIWSHPAENVHYVKNEEEMILAISDAINNVCKRGRKPNKKNMEHCNKRYNKKTLISDYIEQIKIVK